MFELLGTPTEESWPGFSKTNFYSKYQLKETYSQTLRERFSPSIENTIAPGRIKGAENRSGETKSTSSPTLDDRGGQKGETIGVPGDSPVVEGGNHEKESLVAEGGNTPVDPSLVDSFLADIEAAETETGEEKEGENPKEVEGQTNITGVKPHLSRLGLDLLERMLKFDPLQRISAREALRHPYFSVIYFDLIFLVLRSLLGSTFI